MKTNTTNNIWPYLGILVCLFLLSLTAPRQWGEAAKQRTARANVPQQPILPVWLTVETAPAATTPIIQPATVKGPLLNAPPLLPLVPQLATVAGKVTSLALVPTVEKSVAVPITAEILPATHHRIARARSVHDIPMLETPIIKVPMYDSRATAVREISRRSPWVTPTSLLEYLAALAADYPQCHWPLHVTELIEELLDFEDPRNPSATAVLAELHTAMRRIDLMVKKTDDDRRVADLLRVRYALARRLEVWSHCRKLMPTGETTHHEQELAATKIQRYATDILAMVSQHPSGEAWSDYLLLDSLQTLTSSTELAPKNERQDLAKRILRRVDQSKLSPQQANFVEGMPVDLLNDELRRWAVESVDVPAMLEAMENQEKTTLPTDARRLTMVCRQLAASVDPKQQALAEVLQRHYRNANARLAVSVELMNRMMPSSRSETGEVSDHILGVPVQGQSVTKSRLRMKLLPHRRRLRFAFEVDGDVLSETTSRSGPATIYSRGRSIFRADKTVQIGPRGTRTWPAVANVNSDSDLQGIETSYDPVPLIGAIAQSMARGQYGSKRGDALAEVDAKVSAEARHRLDREVESQMEKFKADFSQRLLMPLEKISLKPEPIEMRTTGKRLIARVRIATDDQLAAFTTRPRAPSDSLLSMQLHQSVPTNAISQFDLDGRRFSLHELHAWIAEKLDRTDMEIPDDLPEDVRVKFADHDAVQVRFVDGLAEVQLKIAKLSARRSHWRHFTVRARYEPAHDGIDATLVRKGSISLSGARLNTRAQIVLRGAFAKVFTKSRPIHLISESLVNDARLKDLRVNQFVINDGWIGVAIGPERVDNQTVHESDLARRKKKAEESSPR